VITSTLLTLLVIPTVYEILDNFREWALGKLRRRPVGGSHPQSAASAVRSSD
jgi:HAE1 family hydrophobic/amphiphilic exporter-1